MCACFVGVKNYDCGDCDNRIMNVKKHVYNLTVNVYAFKWQKNSVNTKMAVRAYVNKFEKLHEYENQSKCLSETKCGRSL